MASSLLASLKQQVDRYCAIFFDDKDDLDATADDHVKAVAFRILSSAALEQYVEERCRAAAREGIGRLKTGQETTTGRALIVWFVSRNVPGCIPVHMDDVHEHYGLLDEALLAYLKSVDSNHGLNGRDARSLFNPIGLRSHQLPEDLLNRLQTLADRRDPAVHAVTGKAQGRLGPSLEKKQIYDILSLLEPVDESVDKVVSTYPV